MKYREKGINVCVSESFLVGWRREMVFVWEEKMVANVERDFLCIAVLFYVYIIFMNCLKLLSTRRCSLLYKHRGYAVLIDCLVARYEKKSTMDSATAQYPLTMCYILILNLASVTPT